MSSADRTRRRTVGERHSDHVPGPAASTASAASSGLDAREQRRSASRSLWAACEAFLAPGRPKLLVRALDRLMKAFECDGIAIHLVSATGSIDPWCARGAWRTRAGDLRDCVSVPLLRADERIGTLELMARSGGRFLPAQLGLIRTAAGALGAALGARVELERLRRQPGRDAVTGLPDSRAFHARLTEELARSTRHGVPLALVTVDLDHFAALNARFGMDVGNAVLSEAALVLKLALRESDVVARLGGDGFAILLPEADQTPALRCADRLRRAIEEHRFARVGRLTASAGVAACPRDGMGAAELMHSAELALSIAKKSGRRRVVAADHVHAH
jgi:diguanylate cyclase (GGDEF)-like protein